LAEGSIFCRDGTLAVTVIQQGLIRPIKADGASP
jgi:acyl-CoA thioesterase